MLPRPEEEVVVVELGAAFGTSAPDPTNVTPGWHEFKVTRRELEH